jgi:hypothetical protein
VSIWTAVICDIEADFCFYLRRLVRSLELAAGAQKNVALTKPLAPLEKKAFLLSARSQPRVNFNHFVTKLMFESGGEFAY